MPTPQPPVAVVPPQRGCVRLQCASLWQPQGSAVQSLLQMRAGLLRRTQTGDLRSALLYADGWLIQWHEGSAAAVEAAWRECGTHPNAGRPRVLHRSEGPRTLTEPLELATLHDGSKPTDNARRIDALARQSQAEGGAEPLEIWLALGAPCLLARAEGLAVARREVVALASEDNESVELLRELARVQGVPMAYQRFAGSDLHRSDVGAAYADLAGSGVAVTRVQALSRRAAMHDLARLGVRHLQDMLVLLGDDHARALGLLSEVENLLRGRPGRVRIHVLSPSQANLDAATGRFAALAHASVFTTHSPTIGHAAVDFVRQLLSLPPPKAPAL